MSFRYRIAKAKDKKRERLPVDSHEPVPKLAIGWRDMDATVATVRRRECMRVLVADARRLPWFQ